MLAHLFWLGERQPERTKSFFPKARGVSCGANRKVLSGIIHVLIITPAPFLSPLWDH